MISVPIEVSKKAQGVIPIKVVQMKVVNRTPHNAEATVTNQQGKSGINLRKSMCLAAFC